MVVYVYYNRICGNNHIVANMHITNHLTPREHNNPIS